MKIKSLLIGSAALMTASSGAYAADAIVMADPEPVEYVRVCDVYGTGFFYIPGTETCLKIGGYVRMQFDTGGPAYALNSRFTPTFDVRSETEWGTLRGYAEIEINAQWNNTGAATLAAVNGFGAIGVGGYIQNFNLAHAYIEIASATGTLRLGRTHTPYSRFLGYGSWSTDGGSYGFRNTQEISYTFAGSNGFTAVAALIDDSSNVGTWNTDLEAGVNFAQGWGSIGAIAGYDMSANSWGAKAVLRLGAYAQPGFSGSLQVFYMSGAGSYNVGATNWSAMADVFYRFSPKGGVGFEAQWFDTGAWAFAAGADLSPVAGLRIRPEVRYNTGTTAWAGRLRFDRTF